MSRSSSVRSIPIRLGLVLILLASAWALSVIGLRWGDGGRVAIGLAIVGIGWLAWLGDSILALRRSVARPVVGARAATGPAAGPAAEVPRPPDPAAGSLAGSPADPGLAARALASLRGGYQSPSASPAARPAPSSRA
jgi:hypothetical protein